MPAAQSGGDAGQSDDPAAVRILSAGCYPTGTTTGCCSRPRTGASFDCMPWKRWLAAWQPLAAAASRRAACAAVRADPLRESARASLIQVHLAEGNQSEAVREFARYQALLHADLGLESTPRLRDLIDGMHSR